MDIPQEDAGLFDTGFLLGGGRKYCQTGFRDKTLGFVYWSILFKEYL